VPKARKLPQVSLAHLLALALILGPFLINGPGTALAVIGVAGFGYASVFSQIPWPSHLNVMPKSATASVYGIGKYRVRTGRSIFSGNNRVMVKNLSLRFSYQLAYNCVFIVYGIWPLIDYMCTVPVRTVGAR